MKFKCPIHPDKELTIDYAHFSQGQGCKYCGYKSGADKQRIPFEEVKKNF